MSIHKLGENLKIVNLRFESLVSSERCKTKTTHENYCNQFESLVSSERCKTAIERDEILEGNFDTITECKYAIPSFTDIGGLYGIMIEDCAELGN